MVFAIDGRPPIDVTVGRTIVLDVGTADVVVVLPEVAVVVLTVVVDFATKSCEVVAEGPVDPPKVIPKNPTFVDEEIALVDEAVPGALEAPK